MSKLKPKTLPPLKKNNKIVNLDDNPNLVNDQTPQEKDEKKDSAIQN